MRTVPLQIGNKKLGKIHMFFDVARKSITPKKYISEIVSQIKPQMGYGYAGFSHKKYLSNNITNTIFSKDNSKFENFSISESKVINIIKKAVGLAYKKLPIDKLDIYVFPQYNNFIKERMGGTSGTVVWKNTMLVYINPVPNWEKYLIGSVVHEYNHSVAFKYHTWTTLLDKMVLEGMAEVFLEEVLKKPILQVGHVLTKSEAMKYLTNMGSKLKSKKYSDYDQVFYSDKKYPLWSGYSIGYWLVKNFKKNKKNVKWNEFVQTRPIKFIQK